MRSVRFAIVLTLALSASLFAQRPVENPTIPKPQGPKPRACCTPKVVDSTGKELGPLERWDDRTPSWPNQAWVRYSLAGGDDVVLNVSADAILAGTGLGGSAVVFTSNDCSGNAFVNQMTTPTLTKRYAIVLPVGGLNPGLWTMTNAWLYVTDPFPARVNAGAMVFHSQWDFTNSCTVYPAPGLTFAGPQWGFWMHKVEDLYVKYKRPFWIP
jgi:hypothetical protein